MSYPKKETRKKLAIIGATGQIGKALAEVLLRRNDHNIFLFARSIEKLNHFAMMIKTEGVCHTDIIDNFGDNDFDTVVNCVGLGAPTKSIKAGGDIFRITEKFDDLILDYVSTHKKTLYVNLSSGAVYGKSFNEPVNEDSSIQIYVNNLRNDDFYTISKINSEAKHRSFPNLNIVDLRIFSFFSKFIEEGSGFLLADIITKIKNKETLNTSPDNIARDYISADDLAKIIDLCESKETINDYFDVYSKEPVRKFELLDYFAKEYELSYSVSDSSDNSPTGSKPKYYSTSKKAESLGYKPSLSSMDSIKKVMKEILV